MPQSSAVNGSAKRGPWASPLLRDLDGWSDRSDEGSRPYAAADSVSVWKIHGYERNTEFVDPAPPRSSPHRAGKSPAEPAGGPPLPAQRRTGHERDRRDADFVPRRRREPLRPDRAYGNGDRAGPRHAVVAPPLVQLICPEETR